MKPLADLIRRYEQLRDHGEPAGTDAGFKFLCGELVDAVLELTTPRKCLAQRTADPPQDCEWPGCGCDPHASKVIEALQESGQLVDGSPWRSMETAPREYDPPILVLHRSGGISIVQWANELKRYPWTRDCGCAARHRFDEFVGWLPLPEVPR